MKTKPRAATPTLWRLTRCGHDPLWKLLSWLQLLLCLGLTFVNWRLADSDVTQHAQERFHARASMALMALADRVRAYELALRGGLALFNSIGDVSRGQWKTYADSLSLHRNYPGIQGLGYSPAVFPSARDRHVADMRAQGFPEYGIRPPGEREAYTPVIYLEPDTAINKRAFGFDTFSEPVRRAAIERARDTGEPSITGRITLVQEGATDVQAGFIMFMPLYTTPETPAGVEERRALIKGYVNAPFRMNDFMRGILGPEQLDLGIEVFDGGRSEEQALMFRSAALAGGEGERRESLFRGEERMDILGRPWTIRISSLPGFEASVDRRMPILIALAGVSISILLFASIRALLTARAGVKLLARTARHESDLLQGILGNFPAPYVLVNARLRVEQTNRLFLEMLEIEGTPEECQGRSLGELFDADPEHEAMVARGIAGGEARRNIEMNVQSRQGHERIILASFSPLYDLENACIGGLCIYVDLTKRRQIEVQLAKAGKLEAIGQLAAGIAHEINTPTQYVGNNVSFLKDAFDDLSRLLAQAETLAGEPDTAGVEAASSLGRLLEDIDAAFLKDEIPKAFDHIFTGIERISTIVQAMRRFSHGGGEGMSRADLRSAIETTIEISRNEWKYAATVELDFDPDLPLVMCQQGEINQVLLNVIVNAAQAIAGAGPAAGGLGRIAISTRLEGDDAVIRVRDTGPGIPEGIRDKVFNMFFTTKEVGKGTGQGLAIAYDIVVNKHGGTISFESGEGGGATCVIRLPVDGQSDTAWPAAQDAEAASA